ncbi:MAG: hypothetical protein ABIP55_09740, partial [Tepidisphaeraceae bacterium]
LGRVFREPTFLIAVIILLTAAIGLNLAFGAMKLHFKKAPVPLAKELGAIPSRVGPWVQVSLDKALDKDTQDVLGTDKYIFRDYVDTRVAGETVAEQFKDKSESDRLGRLDEIRKKFPHAVVRLSVTYYTGMVDTVSHVPDRCVTADGFEPKKYDVEKWAMGRDLPREAKPVEDGAPSDNIEVRHIHFEDQTGTSTATITRSIAYFFHANGEFMSSPLRVRQKLADLWVKKGYYCKIETMNTIDKPAESARAMTDFLTFALPEVFKCMPDWAAETAAKPVAQVAAK